MGYRTMKRDLGPRSVILVTTFRMDNKRTGLEGERRLGDYCRSPGGVCPKVNVKVSVVRMTSCVLKDEAVRIF